MAGKNGVHLVKRDEHGLPIIGSSKPPEPQKFIVRVLMPNEYLEEGAMCSHCLIYDENRVIESLVPICENMDAAMKGHQSRYFFAKWERGGEIDFVGVAPNQSW